jgi:hypothetical protein
MPAHTANDKVSERPIPGAGGDLMVLPPQETIPLTVRGRNPLQAPTSKLVWRVELGSKRNYRRLGERLAQGCDDLYRNRSDGMGLIQVLPSGKTRMITKGSELAPILADKVSMVVTKDGKVTSETPQAVHLNAMLRAEVFLSCFRPVDEVARIPYYLDDFTLVRPGYHDGGPGKRILYAGPVPDIADNMATIASFLDQMSFATNSDRTNCLAAAVTALLRHHWIGEKPLVQISSSKSHAGKSTVADFVRGSIGKADILYESIDWPMQSSFQRQVLLNPDLGVIQFDNIRLDSAGGRGKFIRSGFVESFVTSAEITLASPGAGEAITLANKYLVIITTNDGSLSQDILNRALPIHLAPKGSIYDRQSKIGNPKLEFLPENRHRIESELRLLIEKWRLAGCPLDETVNHSMSPWAMALGGILKHAGYADFLANYQGRRAADDPMRRAIGILGATRPGKALRPADWAQVVVQQGLAKLLFHTNERDTEKSRERAVGVLLRPLIGEVFEVATDGKLLRLKLEGGFKRWLQGKNPHTKYKFTVIREEAMPIDEDECLAEAPEGERDANAASPLK